MKKLVLRQVRIGRTRSIRWICTYRGYSYYHTGVPRAFGTTPIGAFNNFKERFPEAFNDLRRYHGYED